MMVITRKRFSYPKSMVMTTGALLALVLYTDARTAFESPVIDSGATSWMLTATALGLASVILAGLVAITPVAGVARLTGVLIIGAFVSIFCYYAIFVKDKLGYNDNLGAFGVYGIGGIVGAILLTFFISKSWMAEAATTSGESWTTLQQLIIQVRAVLIAVIYAVVGKFMIVLAIEKTIGFRADEVHEMAGLDRVCHGEYGYGMLNPSR